ncbi:hypothetical protein RQP53_15385 [Paucibacter sp. APW11]|uniref:Carboxypeptidase regulatory-like domain-containing protein n=1 Tax=Roseateles aquae TaxID=3077235 RepID=A0ABU3PEE7_9BURK|nr:hypothetical protein [Paucibacter sp. APW11]MDT9000657.1 hypothetical protein [Paucibacter sp. APW11]
MQSHRIRTGRGGAALLACAALLAACGGGNNSAVPSRPQLALSGTAATGTAIGNATVQVKCLGASGQTSSAADGSYQLRLDGASLPCVLRVNDGRGRVLHSVAQDTVSPTVAHVTPLTELLLTRSARLAAASAFDSYSDKLAATLSASTISKAQAEVSSLLNGTVDTSGIASFISSPLKVLPGDPHDTVLDKLGQRVAADRFAELSKLLASTGPLPDPAPFKPELHLGADSVTVPVGGTVALVASLNYPPNVRYLRPPLTWSVVETGAGKLADDGLGSRYTAPDKKGVYHLKASRDDYANVSATMTVNVIDFVPVLELSERAITLMPGQSHRFSAYINYPPGTSYVRQPTSWKLLEADGGSISIDGLYQAPSKPGTYHVQVRRDDFPEKTLTVDVKVGDYQSLDRYAMPLQYLGLQPERSVIKDAAAWSSWKKSHGVEAQTDDEVDFSKHMVVAIVWPALKQCGSAELLGLKPQGQVLQASIRIAAAPADTACPAVMWNPVWLLATARSDLPLQVVEQ